MKRIFFHSRTRYLISAGFALLIVLLKLFSSGDFTLLRSYSDGFFIAGFFLLCIGGLSVVNYFGGFDIFSCMVAKRDADGHKPTLHEYAQMKAEKRKSNPFVFVPYFTVGGIALIVALILLLLI